MKNTEGATIRVVAPLVFSTVIMWSKGEAIDVKNNKR